MKQWRVLVTCIGLLVPAAARANGYRLQVVENISGQIWTKSSDDNGESWSGWDQIPPGSLIFDGTPAVISDTPGRFWVVATDQAGALEDNVYTASGWRGWRRIPGTGAGGEYRGAATLASWGAGRVDLFVYRALNLEGGKALRHTWANNGAWTGTWETLGTGMMQGSPAAVSWGYRRIDVFARGGGSELAHKWFDNSSWSGWENLGGYITASPAVASPGPGSLYIFVRGGDGSLWDRYFQNNGWSSWEYRDCCLSPAYVYVDDPISPAAGSRAPGTVDALFVGSDSVTGLQQSFDPYNGWSGFKYRGPYPVGWYSFPFVTATYWVPYATPPPGDGGGGCGPFPC